MMHPCKEGGSVYVIVRLRFSASCRSLASFKSSERKKQRHERSKRMMLFYTPHDVWSLVSFPHQGDVHGPTSGDLAQGFDNAMKNCLPSLTTTCAPVVRVSLAPYAQCISRFFEDHMRFEDHTALRGLAIVPVIINEVDDYSAPSRSSPFGHLFEVPFDLPAEFRQLLPGDLRLTIFAHVPVIVASYDCRKTLWDDCD